jgi:hypothetical protein
VEDESNSQLISNPHNSLTNPHNSLNSNRYKIPPLSLPFHLEITDPRTSHTTHKKSEIETQSEIFPYSSRKKTKSIVMNPVGTLLWFQNKQTQQLRPFYSVLQHHRPPSKGSGSSPVCVIICEDPLVCSICEDHCLAASGNSYHKCTT